MLSIRNGSEAVGLWFWDSMSVRPREQGGRCPVPTSRNSRSINHDHTKGARFGWLTGSDRGAERLVGIREALLKYPMSIEDWSMVDGCFLYKQRLVLPRGSELIPRLLHEFHSSALGGHSSVLKTYKRLSKELFWIGMKKDIQKFVEACSV